MNTAKLKAFLDLNRKKRELQERLDEVQGQLTKLEQELLSEFEQAGVEKLTVDGATVYIHTQLWAGVAKSGDVATEEDKRRAMEALRASGLDDYVYETFNTNSLSAYVREQLAQAPLEIRMDPARWHEALPEPLHGAITITERQSLRVRGLK